MNRKFDNIAYVGVVCHPCIDGVCVKVSVCWSFQYALVSMHGCFRMATVRAVSQPQTRTAINEIRPLFLTFGSNVSTLSGEM